MASSVLLKGLPHDVPLKVLAYHLDKFLDTDEIGTFKVKDLSLESNKWQVVINFESSYDAFTAQSILQGFKYKWKDDKDYVLQAKVFDEPSLRSTSWQKDRDVWGSTVSSSLLPRMSLEDAKCCNEVLDVKLQLLQKQKLLLQTEREIAEEKRKLAKEYRKRRLSDSDDGEVTKHRLRKKKRIKLVDGSKRVKSSEERVSETKRRSMSRSTSKSSVKSRRSVVRDTSPEHSRSRAFSRSIVREISLDHSRSRAVSRSVVREISPDYSKSRAVSRSVVREISPDYSRSRAVSRSVVREASPDHSKSRTVSRSIALGIPSNDARSPMSFTNSTKALAVYKPPNNSRLGPIPGSSKLYARSKNPEHFDYDRPGSYYSRAPVRPRSPDFMAYSRPRSRDYAESYRSPRSPEYVSTLARSRSPDSMRDRDRYRKYYQSRERPRSPYSRSPEYSRSCRRSKDFDGFDGCDKSPDRLPSNKGRDKGRRYDDDEPSSSKDKNTNTRVIDVTISIKRKKTKEPDTEVTSPPTTSETSNTPTLTSKKTVKIKTEYDSDNKDEDFKLQMSKAIREIMARLQVLMDVAKGIREEERRSVLKTLQSIIARRLRSLPLDQCLISDDIVHLYKYTHTEKDDIALILKLIGQLSHPEIVIEDPDITEPPDADNKIWSIIEVVLKDLEMDYFSDDDAKTLIVEAQDEMVDNNTLTNETNIKTEIIDGDNNTNTEASIIDNKSVELDDDVTKPKKHGPRKKVYSTDDINKKIIPPRPKFHITVKNILKEMKPYIDQLRGDMNVLRIIDVTIYEIRRKIHQLLGGKGYLRSAEITKLYRDRYQKDSDFEFVWEIIENFKKGVYSDMSKIDYSCDNGNLFMETQSVIEESDDVIIVEKNNDIIIVDDEDDMSKCVVHAKIPQVPSR